MIQRSVTVFAALLALSSWQADTAFAQGSMQEKVNAGRVTIITGGAEYVNSSYLRYAGEMAAATNEPGELRVLPIMGEGPVENIRDILYLKGIDIGILHSDALTFVQRRGIFPNARNRLRFLAKLYDEYFHLIAHRDIRSVAELAGKKVVIGKNDFSGSTISALTAFELLGIEIETVYDDWAPAIERIEKGEIAAIMYSTVRGSEFVQGLEPSETLRFLPLPFGPPLAETYEPAVFTAEHYPNLIAPGEEVPTLRFGTIMAVYNWKSDNPRYRNVAKFMTALFDNVEAMHEPPFHPRWRNFDPASKVTPGWKRFEPARAWAVAKLEERRRIEAAAAAERQRREEAAAAERQRRAEAATADSLRQNAEFQAFVDYMRARGDRREASDEEMLELFQRFMAWRELESKKPIE
ncbi:MAG: TAXI family TRAP transporter solute-binding subunit [Kiloniellales bacterium]|nr:TAXI family TRAP transporter solute-binding subunit [Kiloniellales bacterium]